MNLKNTIKLFNYTYKKGALILLMVFFFLQNVMYIFMPLGTLMQGFMVSLTSTYFVNFVYQVMVSGMIRSSGKVEKSIIKNFTIILLISSVGGFILFIIPRFIFMLVMGVYNENAIIIFLLNYIVFNILAYVSLAVIYKRMAFGTTILGIAALAFFIEMPFFIYNTTRDALKIMFKIKNVINHFEIMISAPTIGLLAAAFAISIISPFIFYLISILMKNVPVSKYLEDRQPWGKI